MLDIRTVIHFGGGWYSDMVGVLRCYFYFLT